MLTGYIMPKLSKAWKCHFTCRKSGLIRSFTSLANPTNVFAEKVTFTGNFLYGGSTYVNRTFQYIPLPASLHGRHKGEYVNITGTTVGASVFVTSPKMHCFVGQAGFCGIYRNVRLALNSNNLKPLLPH